MPKGFGSGDKLARGAVRATFLPSEKTISQRKWDAMFEDFDPEEFKKNGMPKTEGTGEKAVPTGRFGENK